jgi:hypothetical protein
MPHAYLPPSGAHSWSVCAQWPKMNATFPQEETAESAEGTAAHWAGVEFIRGNNIQAGTAAPNGVILTDEIIEAADIYAETVEDRLSSCVGFHIEETIPIPFIGPECFGTPDVWGAKNGNFEIELIDFKYGHLFVDEYFNPQTLMYILGILAQLGIDWKTDKSVTLNVTIVQPRCFYKGEPVRTHSFSIAEAEPFFHDLKLAASRAMDIQPRATTNSHCGFCPGRHACQALQLAAYRDAEISNHQQPLQLDPKSAALELRMLERAYERLEARVEGLREITFNNLKRGESIPYYRLAEGKGRSQWNIPTQQVLAVGTMFGKDLSKNGVITPLQAKKAGIDESLIKAYSYVPGGNLKLVKDDPADARRVFGRQERK